jgi:GDPmannose 4,6-dehydratase
VAVSFEEPEYTANSDGLGALRILEAIRILGLGKKTRFYQATRVLALRPGAGDAAKGDAAKETTAFYPRSPYAVAKLYAYWITINYREAYGFYACNGILFNHESPARGENLLPDDGSRARSRGRSRASSSRACTAPLTKMRLGNLAAKRDWGHARDYVEMQWLMLQQDKPEDFVIATGVQYSVRDFVDAAATELGMPIRWEGEGVDEKGYNAGGRCVAVVEPTGVDPRTFRRIEVETLVAKNPTVRPVQGQGQTRLDPAHQLRRARGRNGARRPQGRGEGRAGETARVCCV